MLREAGRDSNIQRSANATTSHDAVGKRALTDAGPVQRKEGEAGANDTAGVHAAAARGTATPGGAMPHADQIQRLFGRHDVSGVQAHTGADAKGSADAMGADAYATGNHVVLGGKSDLHTVAHEAAHVVQQRGGVQLKGGVGEAGDPHEQHADKVADAIVAGQSAEGLLDQVAPGGGAPKAAGPVQHKLKHGAQLLTQPAQLNLGAGKTPSKIVNTLLAAPATYYAPAAPDFEAPDIHVLEHKKYILGEHHGDGTFDTRVAKWPGVTKMKEAIKGMKPEGAAEGAAVSSAGTDVRGQDPKGQGLPLEDSHAYTMTRMLLQQQMMNRFDSLVTIPDGKKLIVDGLAEVSVMITQYAEIGLKWCQQNNTRPADARAQNFLAIGLDVMHDGMFAKDIVPVATGKVAPDKLTKPQVAAIQKLLQDSVKHLLALIDTRPMGGGFMGLGKSKQGADPIPNRAQIDKLATPGGGGTMPESIEAGHPVREAAMIDNIKAAPAPLFVQIGDNHVDRVSAAVGAEAVPVKVGTNFDTLTQKS